MLFALKAARAQGRDGESQGQTGNVPPEPRRTACWPRKEGATQRGLRRGLRGHPASETGHLDANKDHNGSRSKHTAMFKSRGDADSETPQVLHLFRLLRHQLLAGLSLLQRHHALHRPSRSLWEKPSAQRTPVSPASHRETRPLGASALVGILTVYAAASPR